MTKQAEAVIASEHGIAIQRLGDISDALGACFGAGGLLVTEQDLGEDFFVLETGLAGELFQKFTNYGIRLAIVAVDFSAYHRRLSELANEHRKHGLIRFFDSREEAQAWLENQANPNRHENQRP